MIPPVLSTSTQRAKLDPREVDRLITYAMGELERCGLTFLNDDGTLICVGTSRGKVARLAKDSLRIFGFAKARRTIDEHIDNLVEVERESYTKGHNDPKKMPPVRLQPAEGDVRYRRRYPK